MVQLVKTALRGAMNGLSAWRRTAVHPQELSASAIVFSPHPDDETLGCGGTIIRKKRAGAKVKVVYMTDGSASHSRFLPASELTALRTREALAACQVLGVDAEDVVFLGFRDGRLGAATDEAVRQVANLLHENPVAQVFVPYCRDTTPDHQATLAIVTAALRQIARPVTIYEYPVWYWMHWPWVSPDASGRREKIRHLLQSPGFWAAHLRELRWAVPIRDVMEQKQLALSQHRTQTVRLHPDSDWPILADVGSGDFLRCFFQENEVFYRHTS